MSGVSIIISPLHFLSRVTNAADEGVPSPKQEMKNMTLKQAIDNLDRVLSVLAYDHETGEWEAVSPGQNVGHFDENGKFIQHEARYFPSSSHQIRDAKNFDLGVDIDVDDFKYY